MTAYATFSNMKPTKRNATYQDVLDAPEHRVAEIVDGDLYTSPRPASPHAHAASTLGMDLGSAFQRGRGGPGGGWILVEPELHLGSHVVVPDLAGWRVEQMAEVPAVAYFELPPDWVCEVLSPRTAALDRMRKLRVYGEQGVGHAWLLDPLRQSLEVYRQHDGHWLLAQTFLEESPVRAEPFDAIELALQDLWLVR